MGHRILLIRKKCALCADNVYNGHDMSKRLEVFLGVNMIALLKNARLVDAPSADETDP